MRILVSIALEAHKVRGAFHIILPTVVHAVLEVIVVQRVIHHILGVV